jgi:hypothetical protein
MKKKKIKTSIIKNILMIEVKLKEINTSKIMETKKKK